MLTSLLVVALVAVASVRAADAPSCESRLAQATGSDFKSQCNACQAVHELDPDGDSPCEFCAGVCFHEDIGFNNEIHCQLKRNVHGKRANCETGQINIMDAGSHVVSITPPPDGGTTTKECLGQVNAQGECMEVTARASAHTNEGTFPEDTVATQTTQATQAGGNDGQTNNGIPGGVKTAPNNAAEGDSQTGKKSAGALCESTGGIKKYYDNCLVCGGDNSSCNSANTLGVSALAAFAALAFRAL